MEGHQSIFFVQIKSRTTTRRGNGGAVEAGTTTVYYSVGGCDNPPSGERGGCLWRRGCVGDNL